MPSLEDYACNILRELSKKLLEKDEIRKLLKAALVSHSATGGKKVTINLEKSRSRESLQGRGTSITVLDKGTGTWTLYLKFLDNSYLQIESSDLADGDVLEYEFKELLMTNSSQSVTNPTFVIDRRIE